MTKTSRKPQAVTTPKGRPTSSQGDSNREWADRWVTIQWTLLGVAAIGLVVVAFYLSGGQDTPPVHSR